MLKFIFFLLLSSQAWAESFQYNIEVNPEQYKLLITMNFNKTVSMSDAIKAFKNEVLLVGVSDSIKELRYEPTMQSEYKQIMKVRSWGISSQLISKCQEHFALNSWMKSCELKMDEGDAGKYMIWKKDQIRCQQSAEGLQCLADIQGKSKDIKILGLRLASAQVFSLKAKIPALYNFSQIWWAANHFTLNIEQITNAFSKSSLKNQIDQMLETGLKTLKQQDSFQLTAEYQEQ